MWGAGKNKAVINMEGVKRIFKRKKTLKLHRFGNNEGFCGNFGLSLLTEEASKRFTLRSGLIADWRVKGAGAV